MKILKVDSDGPNKIVENLKQFFYNENGSKCGYIVEELKDNIESDVIILGRDHSISKKCIQSFVKNNPDSGLILFDAHPDCEDEDDLIPFIVDNGIIDKNKIIVIGIRKWNSDEINYLKNNKIIFFEMKKIFNMGIHEICDTIMETARQWKNLYISIDMDVIDPGFAPGVSVQEPGGFSSRDMIYFIQRLKLLKNLKAVDICEVNPSKDINDMTSKLAAKMVSEFC